MLQRLRQKFQDLETAGIEAQRIGRAEERRVDALGIDRVALVDDVVFALGGAAPGADGGVGIDVEFVGRGGKDDRADVAAFHDERGEGGEALLLRDEQAADGADLRDVGDTFVDVAVAHMGQRVDAADGEGEVAVAQGGFDRRGADEGFHALDVAGVEAVLLHVPGDAAIHFAGTDVDEAEPRGQLAGEGAFARGGGAVDGDDGMGGGHILTQASDARIVNHKFAVSR
jgi:hypothetical protein